MIVCTKCKEEKEESEFNFRYKEKGIYQKHCKMCMRENNRKHYQENKGVYIERAKGRSEENKTWFREFKKTLKCNRCGFNHPAALQFHHTNSEDKDDIVGYFVRSGYHMDKIMNEINKCEVLCANCHMIHHFG